MLRDKIKNGGLTGSVITIEDGNRCREIDAERSHPFNPVREDIERVYVAAVPLHLSEHGAVRMI